MTLFIYRELFYCSNIFLEFISVTSGDVICSVGFNKKQFKACEVLIYMSTIFSD